MFLLKRTNNLLTKANSPSDNSKVLLIATKKHSMNYSEINFLIQIEAEFFQEQQKSVLNELQ